MNGLLKTLGILILFLIFIHQISADEFDKVIYGDDDRKDVFEVQNSFYKELALSTAAHIVTWRLEDHDDDHFRLKAKTLHESGICKDQRFADQITAARCSGFLVAPDIMVTAGHCIDDLADCKLYSWVFDYRQDAIGSNSLIKKENVYSCAKLIERSVNHAKNLDYAVLQLDREVVDRPVLRYRKSGKIEKGDRLLVIGHPSGLPTKIADNAWVRKNSKTGYFETNLDTFGGNSGSAVFNAVTGEVEGILVRGEKDYIWRNNCQIVNHCLDNRCEGEEVTRITEVPFLK